MTDTRKIRTMRAAATYSFECARAALDDYRNLREGWILAIAQAHRDRAHEVLTIAHRLEGRQ